MASSYAVSSTPAETFNKITVSCWFRGMADGTQRNFWGLYDNSSSDRFFALYYSTNGSLYGYWKQNEGTFFTLGTTQKFRDPNAWTHFVMTMDTTLSPAADRVKFYVNGERVTSFEDGLDTITQNQTCNLMNGTTDGRMQWGGGKVSGTQYYWNGSMSHCHMCVGYAYDASSFGSTDSTTGQWKINTNPSVSYGTNGGFWFKDSSALTDSSTNSNTLTSSGTLTQTEDNPSNVFCTFNALLPQSNTGLSKGNTRFETTSGSGWKSMCGNLGMVKNSGKYYMEFKHLGGSYNGYGIADLKIGGIVDQINQSQTTYPGEAANSYGYLSQGELHYNASQTSTGWDTYTTNDIIGMAVDMENMKLYYHKNGSYLQSGNPSTGTNGYSINDPVGAYFPTATVNAGLMCANFGNGNFDGTAISSEGSNASGIGKFEYDVPTGYTALSTKGLNE